MKVIFILMIIILMFVNSCQNTYTMSSSVKPDIPSNPTKPLSEILDTQIGSLSEAEKQILDILSQKPKPNFPLKVSIVVYEGRSEIKDEDFQSITESLKNKLINSGYIQDIFIIPSSLVSSNFNLENIRRIAARFQSDALFIFSSKTEIKTDTTKDLGFWNSLVGSNWYKYSNTKIEIIALDIKSGIFLFANETTKESERYLLDVNSLNYKEAVYNLKRESIKNAIEDIGNKIIEQLKIIKSKLENLSSSSLKSY